MEEELSWSQTRVETVLNEAPRCGIFCYIIDLYYKGNIDALHKRVSYIRM